MRRQIVGLSLLACLASVAGCAMCCNSGLYDYPTYGGKFERVDRQHGRVGSIFSDPTTSPGTPAPQTSGPAMQNEPTNSQNFEELERPVPKANPPSTPISNNDAHRQNIPQRWR